MSAAPIDNILSQLEKVTQRQPGQFSARCPAHADKGPSLSIRETPEGSVLIYCFAGCTVAAVVAAMGLDMTALFPPREKSGREPTRTPRLLTAGQALELLESEATLVAMAAGNLQQGVILNQSDLDRLNKASGRIAWLRNESMGRTYPRRD